MSQIQIESITVDEFPDLRYLRADHPSLALHWLGHVYGDRVVQLWIAESQSLLSLSGSRAWIARKNGKPVGILIYTDSPWETEVLGRPMGQIRGPVVNVSESGAEVIVDALLGEALAWSDAASIEGIVCKVSARDLLTIPLLEEWGFRLADTVLDYVYRYEHPVEKQWSESSQNNAPTIREAREEDLDALLNVAHLAFQHHNGRFHADSEIGTEGATRLYEEWVRSSLKGYADLFLLAELSGQVAGYSVWKLPSELEQQARIPLGHYSIAAVHPDYAGNGLFSALTRHGMKTLAGQVSYLEGPTHVTNLPVQRVYNKLNWKIEGARYSFHRWAST